MATRIPALIQLSDPRVAAQLVNNYNGPKYNTHELDRSTTWQRMRQLRMRMKQRVGLFFPCYFYSVATLLALE